MPDDNDCGFKLHDDRHVVFWAKTILSISPAQCTARGRNALFQQNRQLRSKIAHQFLHVVSNQKTSRE